MDTFAGCFLHFAFQLFIVQTSMQMNTRKILGLCYRPAAFRSLRLSEIDNNMRCNFKMFSSVVPFKLADIGEGIAEVELMKWFVKVMVSCCVTQILTFL